ncbi:MAG TPA: cache domain-containing protein, partial [Anaerolineae bacterium]|nr:cache domain-containing protein [Anaerolineae bacterium]
MVAIIGVYLSTRFVARSLEERFTLQLIDGGNAIADGLARREQLHLSHYNAIAFTEGIDEAILTNDRDKVQSLVFPLVVNNNIDRVDIVNMDGLQVLEIHRPSGATSVEDYTMSNGADLSDWRTVQSVLSGVVDQHGDKYVALSKIDGKELFVTVGPVKQGDDVVGAVLVSSYVPDLLDTLKQASFADVNLYDLRGHLLDTTFVDSEKTKEALALDNLQVRKLLTEADESSLRRELFLEGRRYDLIFGVFRARGEPLGVYSVALQRTFIDSYGETARNYMVLIFAAALVLVFGI